MGRDYSSRAQAAGCAFTPTTGLQNESRAISKRMSAASIGSVDDSAFSYSQISAARTSTSSNKRGGRITPSSTSTERPSAIPRPSLNYSRPLADSSNSPSRAYSNADVKNTQKKRSRTFSQPFAFDPALATDAGGPYGPNDSSTTRTTNALPTPASSRSNSPAIPYTKPSDVKPTRIPKAYSNNRVDNPSRGDGRITPTSSHFMQAQNFSSPQEVTYGDREDYRDPTYESSRSSVNVPEVRPTRQNGIMHEAPPFNANSSYVSDEPGMPRPSAEEERPFEHWYRGDLSRNGGVGELRVGNRIEMLEIANYGHKLRHVANGSMARRRRRAESIGNRESMVFDDYDIDQRGPTVLDEAPLTDMEVDTELETDREMSFTKSYRRTPEQPKRMNANESYSNSSQSTTTPISSNFRPRQDSQIPRATPVSLKIAHRAASTPLSASTSSIPSSGTRSPASPSTAPNSRSPTVVSPAQKRGHAKSPAAAPSGRKPKRAVASPQKRSKSTTNVRSQPREVAEYPDVPDFPEGMADAIPSWTQPKKFGNWDDVVLPVVARKMGLEDQYEEADGSTKPPRPLSQELFPPQPGTFGIDLSKRRQRYDPNTGEVIPLDEFEKVPSSAEKSTSKEESRKSKRFSEAASKSKRPPNMDANAYKSKPDNHYSPPPSPAPFAQYARQAEDAKLDQAAQLALEERHGCCKCIIM
ncbi:hypothetical protein EW145_g1300 [Phellinidium pouzarii]|uniref:Uncharacterized protein n=1 Tax=Phellinidium pouzarii TaxID=167371 RepID=A0A4S4LF09_9AGAM|nr:hypothetical protein EW145_g1300 [Phellinidium pouzarii]